jgi:hypothetical protein
MFSILYSELGNSAGAIALSRKRKAKMSPSSHFDSLNLVRISNLEFEFSMRLRLCDFGWNVKGESGRSETVLAAWGTIV